MKTGEEKQKYLDNQVRVLCKIQSALHSMDEMIPAAPFYKNHKQKLLNIESALSGIVNETSHLFGMRTADTFAEAVKMIDDVADEITYREEL